MNTSGVMWVVYIGYWIFLGVVVWRYERRIGELEDTVERFKKDMIFYRDAFYKKLRKDGEKRGFKGEKRS